MKNHLLSTKYQEKINNYLRTELLKEYDDKIIDKVLKTLEIKIESKTKINLIEDYAKKGVKKYNSSESFDSTRKPSIGKYVQKTFSELVSNNLIDRNEIERLQRHDYSKMTFDIQFPFLAKVNSTHYERIRYWKNPYHINGENFFVCSQWYETSANNDRPYYEEWLKRMKS